MFQLKSSSVRTLLGSVSMLPPARTRRCCATIVGWTTSEVSSGQWMDPHWRPKPGKSWWNDTSRSLECCWDFSAPNISCLFMLILMCLKTHEKDLEPRDLLSFGWIFRSAGRFFLLSEVHPAPRHTQHCQSCSQALSLCQDLQRLEMLVVLGLLGIVQLVLPKNSDLGPQNMS